MRLGIFTDAHYSSREISCGKRFNNRSLRKIKEAYSAFQDARCDLIICLGDLTDTEETHEQEAANLRSIAQVIQSCPIPSVYLMGNHDAFAFSEKEFFAEKEFST
jgi:predicted phosphodiesterase